MSRLCEWKVSWGTAAWLCTEIKNALKCLRLSHASVCVVTLPSATVTGDCASSHKTIWHFFLSLLKVPFLTHCRIFNFSPRAPVKPPYMTDNPQATRFNHLFAASCKKNSRTNCSSLIWLMLLWPFHIFGRGVRGEAGRLLGGIAKGDGEGSLCDITKGTDPLTGFWYTFCEKWSKPNKWKMGFCHLWRVCWQTTYIS